VMSGRMIFSRVLAIDERSEIGLYDVPFPRSFWGFGIGMIFVSF